MTIDEVDVTRMAKALHLTNSAVIAAFEDHKDPQEEDLRDTIRSTVSIPDLQEAFDAAERGSQVQLEAYTALQDALGQEIEEAAAAADIDRLRNLNETAQSVHAMEWEALTAFIKAVTSTDAAASLHKLVSCRDGLCFCSHAESLAILLAADFEEMMAAARAIDYPFTTSALHKALDLATTLKEHRRVLAMSLSGSAVRQRAIREMGQFFPKRK